MSNPKKSHAFIITFVLVLLLLLLGYWLFTNRDRIFKTEGLNLGRNFDPLVESPDRKPLGVIWDSIFNPGKPKTNTDPNGSNTNPNTSNNNQNNNSNKCNNNTDNYPDCTTKNGVCINGTTNPPKCTTLADGKCQNGAMNPTTCDVFEHPFCAANKITKELSSNKNTDRDQVKFLQTILSKLPSSLGGTYLKESDIDGGYGPKTISAVKVFQKDNKLNQTGSVDIATMNALNNKCNEFFNGINDPSIAQCADGIDNDKKEGIDSADPSCHSDFDAKNSSSYDKNIRDEARIRISAECGDGINNDREQGPDYLDKDCYRDGIINKEQLSYDKYITSEKGTLPIPDKPCENGAINYPICDRFTETNKCTPPAVNYPQCNKDENGDCLNGSKNANCVPDNIEKNKCAVFDQYPLEFTEKERADLAELLRKFYLLAPTLKTEEDLNLLYNEINRYKDLIAQTNNLTKQCYLETGYQWNWNWGFPDTYDFCKRNPKLCDKELAKKSDCDINPSSCIGKDIYNDTYISPSGLDEWSFIKRYGNPWFNPTKKGSYLDEDNAKKFYPIGTNLNKDDNYVLKNKRGLKEFTPIVTKRPMSQYDREKKDDGIHLLWSANYNFDINGVMIDRIREFELLLYIW